MNFGNGGSRPGTHPTTRGAPAGPTQTAGSPAGKPRATSCSVSGVAVQNRFHLQTRAADAEMTSFSLNLRLYHPGHPFFMSRAPRVPRTAARRPDGAQDQPGRDPQRDPRPFAAPGGTHSETQDHLRPRAGPVPPRWTPLGPSGPSGGTARAPPGPFRARLGPLGAPLCTVRARLGPFGAHLVLLLAP